MKTFEPIIRSRKALEQQLQTTNISMSYSGRESERTVVEMNIEPAVKLRK
jgi:hypothetical protein